MKHLGITSSGRSLVTTYPPHDSYYWRWAALIWASISGTVSPDQSDVPGVSSSTRSGSCSLSTAATVRCGQTICSGFAQYEHVVVSHRKQRLTGAVLQDREHDANACIFSIERIGVNIPHHAHTLPRPATAWIQHAAFNVTDDNDVIKSRHVVNARTRRGCLGQLPWCYVKNKAQHTGVGAGLDLPATRRRNDYDARLKSPEYPGEMSAQSGAASPSRRRPCTVSRDPSGLIQRIFRLPCPHSSAGTKIISSALA